MPRRSRGPLLLAALGLLAFAVLAVTAARPPLQVLDRDARRLVQTLRDDGVEPFMAAASSLGEGTVLVPLIALGVLLLWRRHRRWALALPAVMAGAGALQALAKWAVDRPRPDQTPWGFPSGHALVLVVLFGLLIYLAGRWPARRGLREAVTLGCATPVGLVGFSRLYLDRHWLTDVAGGALLGLAYLVLVVWLVERGAGSAPAPAVRDLTPTGPRPSAAHL